MSQTPQVVAVVPITGTDPEFSGGTVPMLAGRPLLDYTYRALTEARRLHRVLVSTDTAQVRAACQDVGFEVPFLRSPLLGNPEAAVTQVLRHAVEWLAEHEECLPDWILMACVTYPFRPKGFIDSFIETVLARELDSAVAVMRERQAHWMVDGEGAPHLVTHGGETAKSRKRTIYRELSGLACLVRREVILAGNLYGQQLGVIPTETFWATVNVHDPNGWPLAELLAPRFLETLQARDAVAS